MDRGHGGPVGEHESTHDPKIKGFQRKVSELYDRLGEHFRIIVTNIINIDKLQINTY